MGNNQNVLDKSQDELLTTGWQTRQPDQCFLKYVHLRRETGEQFSIRLGEIKTQQLKNMLEKLYEQKQAAAVVYKKLIDKRSGRAHLDPDVVCSTTSVPFDELLKYSFPLTQEEWGSAWIYTYVIYIVVHPSREVFRELNNIEEEQRNKKMLDVIQSVKKQSL